MNDKAEFYPRIEDFIRIYHWHDLPVGRNPKAKTKKGNCLRMRQILVDCGIDPELQDIRAFAKKAKNGLPICEDYLLRNGSGGANNMRQARSMFSKRWLNFYRHRGIPTEYFDNWVGLSLPGVRIEPFDPCDQEENGFVSACESLAFTNPEMYKAYLLAYGIGLRSSEILRAKYDDFYEAGNHLVRIHNPKCGGSVQVRPCDPTFWKLIKGLDDGQGLIVPGNDDLVTRTFPAFLRDVGVKGGRPVHRLRKYCGHRIMRENNNNAFVAMHALGHSSVEMTQKIYVGLPNLMAS